MNYTKKEIIFDLKQSEIIFILKPSFIARLNFLKLL